jgi:DNA modification methylase
MNTRHIPIKDIKPNPDNPRIIKDDKFHKLVESVRKFPQMLELRPIVVNSDMVVLGGNMRLKACQAAGLKEVPVILASGLTDEQQREFIIKDNVGFGEWDWDALANEWDAAQLTEWGLDIPDYTAEPTEGLTDPDEAPEPPVDPITRTGDLWLLGKHRVLCGDSTDAGAWDTLMNGQPADMVWTDPPYGVSYVGKTKDALTIDNDSLDADSLEDFLRGVFALALVHTRDGGSWYVAAPAGPLQKVFDCLLVDIGVRRQCLVWLKDQFVMGRSDYHYRHEPIFYGWKPGAAHKWNGGRKQDSVLEIERPRRNTEHPTMKPVALVTRCLENSSDLGNLVVDPFGGSGTTLLAAESIGRTAYLIELSPSYCDVIVKRWQAFTGQQAIHSVTGEAFDLMANSRKGTG